VIVNVLCHFTALGVGSVEFRPVSDLERAQVLRPLAKALLDVVAIQTKVLPIGSDSSKCDMDMRMFGIEVPDGQSFKRDPSPFVIEARESIAGDRSALQIPAR
jgi:hypothetical protein